MAYESRSPASVHPSQPPETPRLPNHLRRPLPFPVCCLLFCRLSIVSGELSFPPHGSRNTAHGSRPHGPHTNRRNSNPLNALQPNRCTPPGVPPSCSANKPSCPLGRRKPRPCNNFRKRGHPPPPPRQCAALLCFPYFTYFLCLPPLYGTRSTLCTAIPPLPANRCSSANPSGPQPASIGKKHSSRSCSVLCGYSHNSRNS